MPIHRLSTLFTRRFSSWNVKKAVAYVTRVISIRSKEAKESAEIQEAVADELRQVTKDLKRIQRNTPWMVKKHSEDHWARGQLFGLEETQCRKTLGLS